MSLVALHACVFADGPPAEGVKGVARLTDVRYCGGDGHMDVLQLTAQVLISSQRSDPIEVPAAINIERVLIARSADDLAHHKYEFNASIDSIQAASASPDAYQTLKRGGTLNIERQVRVVVPRDPAGQPMLASLSTHRLTFILGVPIGWSGQRSDTSVLTALQTDDADLSLGARSPTVSCGDSGTKAKIETIEKRK